MTDREKLVGMLIEADREIGILCDGCGSRPEQEVFGNIADHMIAHGVTVREPKKPLTVEDILVSPFQIPCWIERNKNGCVSIVADVLDRSDYDRFFGQVDANMMRQGLVDHMTRYRAENYGKTWRCWAEKPTEEERKAAEWEK